MWNFPVHCVNICCCDWFNKEADWPIAGQDKVRCVWGGGGTRLRLLERRNEAEESPVRQGGKQEVQDEREVMPCGRMKINRKMLSCKS